MLQIRLSRFFGPSLALFPPILGHVRSFREDKHPHWNQLTQACQGIPLFPLEFVQSVLEAWLILCPFSREEDEAEEKHAGTHERDVFEFVFKNDEEMSSHVIGVGHPPKVKPVGVNLVRALAKDLNYAVMIRTW